MSDITVIGKASPEIDDIQQRIDHGFTDIELYLEKSHLEQLNETIALLDDANVSVQTVHTPHVTLDELQWIEKADELASYFDAYLVIHSSHICMTHIYKIDEQISFSADHGYENQAGASVPLLQNIILINNHDLVLDTAHLFMAHPDTYLSKLHHLLTTYSEQINVIHLCDSTVYKDGLGFGNGSIDMKTTTQLIQANYSNTITIEVPPQEQPQSYKKYMSYLNEGDSIP